MKVYRERNFDHTAVVIFSYGTFFLCILFFFFLLKISAANKLKQAKALRQLQIDHVDDLLTLHQMYRNDSSKRDIFKVRCNDLNTIYDAFQNLHCSVISLLATTDAPDFSAEKAMRSNFLDSFYTVKTAFSSHGYRV